MYNNFMMGGIFVFNLLAFKFHKVNSLHILLCLPLIHNKINDSKTTFPRLQVRNKKVYDLNQLPIIRLNNMIIIMDMMHIIKFVMIF
jgi:hypothetical protein